MAKALLESSQVVRLVCEGPIAIKGEIEGQRSMTLSFEKNQAGDRRVSRVYAAVLC
jgi:hypothetical protein